MAKVGCGSPRLKNDVVDIPRWLDELPSGLVTPPIVTRPHLLPTDKLDWQDFERLILRLARVRSDVHGCRLYGARGQSQGGIDIITYVRDLNDPRPIVYQCKRIAHPTEKDIEDAVSRFLLEQWDPPPSEFILCFSAPISKTQLIDRITAERARLGARNTILSIWDQEEISGMLKTHPNIVGDFFGKAWVRSFIGPRYSLSNVLQGYSLREEEVLALRSYLTWLHNKCEFLASRIISDPEIKVRGNIAMSSIYVCPDTYERVATCEDIHGKVHRILPKDIDDLGTTVQCVGNWDLVSMTVFEVFSFYGQVVLLGAPGSGKSTAMRYLASSLAAASTVEFERIPGKLEDFGWNRGIFLPIVISLADFVRSQSLGPTANDLWDFFQTQIRAVAGAVPAIKAALTKGRAVVLLDDLDLISAEKQETVLKACLDFVRLYSSSRYVLACRESEYRSKVADMLPGFHSATISPLIVDKVEEFAENWYAALRSLGSDVPQGAADDLKNAIRRSDAAQLAQSPLLLTQMALIHSAGGKLPEDRVSLYSEVVRLLFARLNKAAEDSSPDRIEFDRDSLDILENWLHEISYVGLMKARLENSGVDKSRAVQLMQRRLGGDVMKARQLCDLAESRLGLVIEEDGALVFPHRSFQEYFAGCYLQSQRDFISRGVDIARGNFAKWRGTFTMAVALAGPDLGVSAVRSMCPLEPQIETAESKAPDWYAVWMAAEALSELSLIELMQRPERLEVLDRIRRWLILLIETDALTVHERNEIGKLLSKLGDTRPGVLSLEPCLVKVPRGSVILGNDRITKGNAYSFSIPYDFYTSKYLVTNAQYEMFLADNPKYPLPESGISIWNPSTRKPNPYYLNHPVVGVSWLDAKAYCDWLTSRMRLDVFPSNYVVRLATDAEWMKMYRGGERLPDGTTNPYPTRVYPWGDEWVDDRANVPEAKANLSQTTAVGLYPSGATPYGIVDACGNVLEWTSTSWGGYDVEKPTFSHPYNAFDGRESPDTQGLRIARGGSWLFSEGSAKCACRLDPLVKFPDTGFRVVVGPKNLASIY